MAETRTDHELARSLQGADRGGGQLDETVGRYQLMGWLASGGMGDVYVGHDPKLERPVAIKRIRADLPNDAQRRERLVQEARLGAQLSHKNVVQVYDLVTEDDVDYLVTEYVDGLSVRELGGNRPFAVGRALELLIGVAEGLAAAHAAGIIHRDLKSENVLVGYDGTVRISDFGIAKALGRLHDAVGGGGDSRSGTYRAMSPEQTVGDDTDSRTDLFSLGTLGYELLTGQTPFSGASPAEIMRNIREQPHKPVIELSPVVPFELSRVIDQLLEKDRELRPPGASDVLRALEKVSKAVAAQATVDEEGVSRSVAIVFVQAHPTSPESDESVASLVRWRRAVLQSASRLRTSVVSAFDRELLLCVGYPRSHADNCKVAAWLLRELVGSDHEGDGIAVSGALDVGRVTVLDPDGEPYFVGTPLRDVVAFGRDAAVGTILASTRAQPRLADAFHLTARTASRASGGTTLAYVVGAPRDALIEGASELSGPLFGRDTELRRLQGMLSAAAAGEHPGGLLLVSGPGMGKTRLIHEVLAQPEAKTLRRLVLRARESTQHTALAPFATLLRTTIPELRDESGGEPSAASIAAAVRRLGLSASTADAVQMLCDLQPATVGPADSETRLREILVELLLTLVGEQPAVVVFEDLHWSDRSSLEVFDALVQAADERALAVIGTARPEVTLPDPLASTCPRMGLPKLSDQDAGRVIAEASRGAVLLADVGRLVVERAEGVPLALEEMTRTVVERDRETQRGEALRVVPATLSESINERLDALPGAPERLAVLAATFGGDVDLRVLAAAAELPLAEARAHVRALTRHGLLAFGGSGDEGRAAFRHASLRDVVIERVLPTQRARAHAAIVRGIDEATPGWGAAHPEVVAHHQERAGDVIGAIANWRAAGTQHAARWMLATAREQFEHAIALAQAAGHAEAELEVRRAFSRVLMSTSGWGADEGDANNVRMSELVADTEQSPSFEDQYGAAIASYVKGDVPTLSGQLDGLSAVVQGAPPEARGLLEYLVEQVRGIVHVHTGPLVLARKELERAVELRPMVAPVLRQTAGPEGLIAPRAYLAWCELLADREDAALRLQREEEDDHLEDPVAHAIASAFGITLALGALRWDDARTRVERVLEEVRRQAEIATEQKISAQIVFTAEMGRAVLEMRDLAVAKNATRSDVERVASRMRHAYRGWQQPFMRVATVINLTSLGDACLSVAAAHGLDDPVGVVAARHAGVFLGEALSLVDEDNPIDDYWRSETLRVESNRKALIGDAEAAAECRVRAREAIARYADGNAELAALLTRRLERA